TTQVGSPSGPAVGTGTAAPPDGAPAAPSPTPTSSEAPNPGEPTPSPTSSMGPNPQPPGDEPLTYVPPEVAPSDESGGRLWLRYPVVTVEPRLSQYRAAFTHVV